MYHFVKDILSKPEHPSWVITQQALVRGLTALKFLLAARLLGPEQIGFVGIALLSLAVVESLSETGLSHAIIQRSAALDREEAGAVWTLLSSRGLVLSALLFTAAGPISAFFKLPSSAELIVLSAAIPLLRNAVNPGVFLVQRNRDFRKLAIYEAGAASVDLTATLSLIYSGWGPGSLLVGNIASDSVKLLSTWVWLRFPIRPNWDWRRIRSLTSFGKWIWGSTVITLVINQLDKALVAKLLSATEFGLYQAAARIAQMIVADGVIALGQYLYPTFSQRNRISSQSARVYFIGVMRRLGPIVAVVSLVLAGTANILLDLVLGPEWVSAAPVLRVMSLSMFFGAILAVLVAYIRAVGKPKIVTTVTAAMLLQLTILVVVAPRIILYYGSVGIATANAVILASAVALFAFLLRRHG